MEYGYPQNYLPGMTGGPMPSYGGGADPLKLFNRQPYYSPMPMSPGLMNNPLGLAIGLYGVPMMQQLAGPGNFVPNLMQAQGMTDQITAHNHQRAALSATFSTAKHGQDSLQNAVTGIMSLATGEKPNQLMREHADMAASVLNDPFAKMFLGQLMGPDTMEQLFYGSKGDPAALASAVGRVGFYRKDAMGRQRMTAESMAEMSSNVYEQLYGDNADIADMRGISAGQAGQLFEHLFQTGRLPQSLGALSSADRVKALASGDAPRDADTLDRLGREFTHRDLMERNIEIGGRKYSELTREEQKAEVERQLPNARNKLNATLAEVDKFQRGDSSMQAEEIEKLDGFSSLAGNFDANKATSTLKEYAGAVKAVQQIFGAAGNPNAPFPALIAVLNQLTAGGSLGMTPTQVESNIKQLHNAATEAGMSAEQMMQVHQIQAATNRAAGISPEADLAGTASVIRSLKAANDAGEFGFGYGRMSQGEAQEFIARQNASAVTSNAGRSLAALTRMVENSPETMGDDTDASRLVSAVKNKETTFVNKRGETVDIGRAMLDPEFFDKTVEASGGNISDFSVLKHDAITLQRYAQDGGEYVRLVGQASEAQGILRNHIRTMLDPIRDKEDGAFKDTQAALGDQLKMGEIDTAIGEAAASAIIEETTADMTDRQKFNIVSKHMRAAIDKNLEDAGVADADERKKHTDAIFNATMGSANTDRQSSRFASAFLAQGANALRMTTSGNISTIEQVQQVYRDSVTAPALDASRAAPGLAERQIAIDRGHETNAFQRVGDELQRIGRGESADIRESLERVINAVPIAEMAEKGGPELVAALRSAGEFGADGKTLVNAYNTGRKEDIQAAANALAQNALGPGADTDAIAEFAQTMLSGDPEKLTAALDAAGVRPQERDKFRTSAAGLRTAKDYSLNKLIGQNLTLEELTEHVRRLNIRTAAGTAAQMDAEAVGPDGLTSRVARSFDLLQRAEGETGRQTAVEEIARQILGRDGTPEAVADLAEALQTGEVHTPEEAARIKNDRAYADLSLEDRHAVTLADSLIEAEAAIAAGRPAEAAVLETAARRQAEIMGIRRAGIEAGLLKPDEEIDAAAYSTQFVNGVLTESKLNGKDIDYGLVQKHIRAVTHEAFAADTRRDIANADFVSDDARAVIAARAQTRAGNYDFTPEEEKSVVRHLAGKTPEERAQINKIARGVNASLSGVELTEQQKHTLAIASVLQGRDAAAAIGDEAAAALNSILDDKSTNNVKEQADVIARSVLGPEATDAAVSKLADNILKTGADGGKDYTAVIDAVDTATRGDTQKRQNSMDLIFGFNAARTVREDSSAFDRVARSADISKATQAVQNFGTAVPTEFGLHTKQKTEKSEAEFLRTLGGAIGVSNTRDGDKQDEFIAAMKSGDQEKIAAISARLNLSDEKKAQLFDISKGLAAVNQEGATQKEAAEDAKKAAEPARDVSLDTKTQLNYGLNARAVAETERSSVNSFDSTLGAPGFGAAAAGFFGTASENDAVALGAGAVASAPPPPPQPRLSGGGTTDGTRISGTLKLQGLQEVIAELLADNNMEPTPDGAMVDLGNPNQAYRGSRPTSLGQV